MPAGLPSWRSPALQQRFEQAQQSHASGEAIRPLLPAEAAALLVDCRYEEVVRGLSFILSGRDLLRAIQQSNPPRHSAFNDCLSDLVAGRIATPLSPAQLSVARMVHALRVLGLDSATHAGDRAISMVQPYREKLENGIPEHLQTSGNTLSHRVVGAASLIAAQASRDPAAQPCGVQIARAARERRLPCIMVSSHHALGGDAVPLIAEHCAREGLLNGEVSCQRLGFTSNRAHIFWVFKQDPLAWRECFERLGAMTTAATGHVLIVQDTLSSLSDDLLPFPIDEVIRAAHSQSPTLCNKPLMVAQDKEQAMEAMASFPIAAVATDLFMPTRAGSQDKSCGEATVREVLMPYLQHSDIDLLLTAAQAAEDEVASVMSRELAALIMME